MNENPAHRNDRSIASSTTRILSSSMPATCIAETQTILCEGSRFLIDNCQILILILFILKQLQTTSFPHITPISNILAVAFSGAQKTSTVARANSFYVACNKNGFLSLDIDYIVFAAASSITQHSQFGYVVRRLLVVLKKNASVQTGGFPRTTEQVSSAR